MNITVRKSLLRNGELYISDSSTIFPLCRMYLGIDGIEPHNEIDGVDII